MMTAFMYISTKIFRNFCESSYVCISRGKKCLFFGKFCALCFFETPVLRFARLSYYRHFVILIEVSWKNMSSVWWYVRGHSKSTFVEKGRGFIEKQIKTNSGRGVLACVYVRFLKKMLSFQNEVLTVILQFFLLIWQYGILNKPSWKIILSPVNEWRAVAFCSPFYVAQLLILFSALSIIFFAHFQQKWLFIIHWL